MIALQLYPLQRYVVMLIFSLSPTNVPDINITQNYHVCNRCFSSDCALTRRQYVYSLSTSLTEATPRIENIGRNASILIRCGQKEGESIMKPIVMRVARCIVVRSGRVLLVQRLSTTSWFPNLWEFPGGKQDPGQSAGITYRRELFEETSLKVTWVQRRFLVTYGLRRKGMRHKNRNLRAIATIAIAHANGNVLLSNEHVRFAWIPVSEFFSERILRHVTPVTRVAARSLRDEIRAMARQVRR